MMPTGLRLYGLFLSFVIFIFHICLSKYLEAINSSCNLWQYHFPIDFCRGGHASTSRRPSSKWINFWAPLSDKGGRCCPYFIPSLSANNCLCKHWPYSNFETIKHCRVFLIKSLYSIDILEAEHAITFRYDMIDKTWFFVECTIGKVRIYIPIWTHKTCIITQY